MPIHTDLHTEALLAQYRAQRTTTRAAQAVTDAPVTHKTKDRGELSISANLTTDAANGIMFNSVVEQINKALQEGGIDLKVEEDHKIDTSPEGTARRIVDFATGFLDTYRQNHTDQSNDVQIQGFMSLTRNAIEKGFQQATDFLKGITKLSETMEKNMDKTFELTHQYLDAFQQAQQTVSESGIVTPPETTVEV